MEEVIDKMTSRDTKERLWGVERLQTFLDQSQKGLSANEVLNLMDASMPLLRDNNHKVCQGILHALTSATTVSGEHFKMHLNQLIPAIIERLGDNKQSVRDAGRRLLLALMEVFMHSTIIRKISFFVHTIITCKLVTKNRGHNFVPNSQAFICLPCGPCLLSILSSKHM